MINPTLQWENQVMPAIINEKCTFIKAFWIADKSKEANFYDTCFTQYSIYNWLLVDSQCNRVEKPEIGK